MGFDAIHGARRYCQYAQMRSAHIPLHTFHERLLHIGLNCLYVNDCPLGKQGMQKQHLKKLERSAFPEKYPSLWPRCASRASDDPDLILQPSTAKHGRSLLRVQRPPMCSEPRCAMYAHSAYQDLWKGCKTAGEVGNVLQPIKAFRVQAKSA